MPYNDDFTFVNRFKVSPLELYAKICNLNNSLFSSSLNLDSNSTENLHEENKIIAVINEAINNFYERINLAAKSQDLKNIKMLSVEECLKTCNELLSKKVAYQKKLLNNPYHLTAQNFDREKERMLSRIRESLEMLNEKLRKAKLEENGRYRKCLF